MSASDEVSRRRFVTGVGVASAAMGALALTHVILPPGPYSVDDNRSRIGADQDLPVNRSAREAAVVELASDPNWRLTLAGDAGERMLTLADLDALPQRREVLPISCVEGWTATAEWRGVRLADLLDLAGIPHDATVRLRSMQQRGAFRTTTMPPQYTRDPKTLVALQLNGERLSLDHGYPARIIAPGRPGVLQTKWLTAIEVA